jgi:hypothetical protein
MFWWGRLRDAGRNWQYVGAFKLGDGDQFPAANAVKEIRLLRF